MKKFLLKKIYGIEIVAPTKKEINKLKKALEFIKIKEEKVLKILQWLRAILVFPGKTYNNWLVLDKKIYICQPKTILESTKQYLASLLVHEAKHIFQYKNKQKTVGRKAEFSAYKFQRKFLVKYGKPSEVEWLDQQFQEKWWLKFEKESKGTTSSSNYKTFLKFIDLYIKGKLKIT
jgi:hypothetical protein